MRLPMLSPLTRSSVLIVGRNKLVQGQAQRCVTTITTGPSSSSTRDRPLPLEGIRVVECGHLIAGPFAGTILSYFGADVIKVEPPTGDQVRDYRELDSTKTSLWWYSLGRNKRSVAIDMKKEEGRKLIEELIEQSDVLIENFRPGRMEKWGLGPDHFEKSNPKLVYTRVSGFGQDGPYSSRPGFASVCEAMGGFRYVNGFADRPPARPNLSIGDTIAGIHAALGIVIALLGRERGAAAGLNTKGQIVDVAIYESMFNLMEAVVPEYDYSGSIRECSGSTITGIVPSNTYVTKNKKNVVLAANTDSLFVKLMNAIGREDMATDSKYRTNADRVVHQAEIDAAMVEWTATQDLDTVVAVMEKATVPVGLVYSVEDMVKDPQYQQRGMFEEVEIPDGETTRKLKVPAILPKLKATPGETRFAGRKLGQDTRQVLADVLGRSQKDIKRLLDEKRGRRRVRACFLRLRASSRPRSSANPSASHPGHPSTPSASFHGPVREPPGVLDLPEAQTDTVASFQRLHGMPGPDDASVDQTKTNSSGYSFKAAPSFSTSGLGSVASVSSYRSSGQEVDVDDCAEECADSDILESPNDGEMTIMNDDDAELSEEEEEVMEHSIDFSVNRATVTRAGVIPCCVFVGRVRWGTTDWEIYFGQKQILRLHFQLHLYCLLNRHKLMRGVHLPWTIWREKRAEKRVADVYTVQDYIRALLKDRYLRNSEPLLSFLEVSPSRAMLRLGPSLKEGYVHMRINGPFQLPLYTCFNRTIEALYRHLYRAWMRIAFVSTIVGFIFPVCLVILTSLPTFFSPQKELVNSESGTKEVSTKLNTAGVFLGLGVLAGIIFFAGFVYKFFQHRLGVIRRWVVLKPSCFAAYRNRNDREPSEVFLFDKTFTARKGSYRQGVSWMPSGLVVGSKAGDIEIDTGHYYTRLTAFIALMGVCYGIMRLSNSIYDFDNLSLDKSLGVPITNASGYENWTQTTDIEYCGYYFTVPQGVTVYVESDEDTAVVSQLQMPSSNSMTANLGYFWQSDSMGNSLNVITNAVGAGTMVSVVKPIDAKNDRFFESGTNYSLPRVGNLALTGVDTDISVQSYSNVDSLCAISVRISPVTWRSYIYYIMFLFAGGIIAPVAGFLANYFVTYLGVWHPHVRRDHWYRCVRRLQKLKRQETSTRFNSFAPHHVSTLADDDSAAIAAKAKSAKLPVGLGNTSGSAINQVVDSVVKLEAETVARLGGEPASSRVDSSTQSEESFKAPPPPPSAVSWHVDAEDTYEAMYKAISNAKYEILIAGWWVCPDLFLLRPRRKLPPRDPEEDPNGQQVNKTMLRQLLMKKAEAGVKIYVLIYREVKLALTLNSAYTKRSLMVHPNIRVLRDPIFQIQSLGFWSHHEKIVCIDQSLAFVGGLDLCFGRYDHQGHPISDPGDDPVWRGKDYSNPIIKDFVRVNKPFEDLIDRAWQPRMPWHDVHCSISGPPVQDVAYHFIQRWNFVCSKNDYQLRTGWCICFRSRRFKFLPKCLVPMDFNGWTLQYPSSDPEIVRERDGSTRTTIPLVREDSLSMEPFQVVQSLNPIYPCSATGPQWQPTSSLNPLNLIRPPITSASGPLDDGEVLRAQRGESILQVFHPSASICNIQVCRSVSMWSAGVPTEASIQAAYMDVIANSKHFLYIENQFFISGMDGNGIVRNRILQALVDRIERAVQRDEKFRVYVVMPLLPAFEGNVRSHELTNLHAVMHWQFATICRGRYSLFEALKGLTSHPEQYVAFFGLRKYGIMPNGCVSTEQIYIHSKLMIADDRCAIIGSANINDRSMNGDRDSEIALVIEDMQYEDGVMNEKPYRRGVAASKLRMQLFREHLGLTDEDLSIVDATSDRTWQTIKSAASSNTKIFESVFDCAPSNRMRAFINFQSIEVTQIFENQRMNVLKVPGRAHVWDAQNLKDGDYAPWTDVNGVPIAADRVDLRDFEVDNFRDRKKKLFSMDHDGWCYARNFSIFQEVRTMKTDYKKREKLQHLVADRLMAQVRRRRWVKKGLLPPRPDPCDSSFSIASDEEEHGRFYSLWRRLQQGDFSRSNSISTPTNFSHLDTGGGIASSMSVGGTNHGRRLHNSSSLPVYGPIMMSNNTASRTAVLGDDPLYPNSPSGPSFQTPQSPSVNAIVAGPRSVRSARTSSLLGTGGGVRTRANTRSARGSFIGVFSVTGGNRNDTDDDSSDAGSDYGGGHSIRASLKRWYSTMDVLDFGRRSKFNAEYFDSEDHLNGDDPLLEEGQGSYHAATREGLLTEEGADESDAEDADCQISHVQTAATVRKEDETRARGQLSEIRGHLVEFPLDFLVEEILKPSVLPADIHI
ncbi:Phospholipase D [Phytophthora fragariae]|uniref:phospholipase D n=1 Tax=Phytophthora fragariae TaxID=53985 RepID=A0A6A3UIN9_9STRA|nr:Phospholipase D [Phytophthora fragariae]